MFFIFQRGLLIVEWAISPSFIHQISKTARDNSTAKKFNLYYPKGDVFANELVSIIWKDNGPSENIKHLLNNWLTLLQEEHVLNKSVLVEDVAISSVGQEAYISFDRSLLMSEWSIHKKWLLIQSLLKSLQEAETGVKFVIFLVNQRPMEDEHIDFSQPLPVDGFDGP